MSDKLEQVSVEVIKAMLDNLGQAKHFVLEQAPDVMREIVLLGRVRGAALLAGALLLAMASRWCFKKHSGYGDWLLGALMTAVASIALVIVFAMDGITPWVAPKVYLMQQLADMLK